MRNKDGRRILEFGIGKAEGGRRNEDQRQIAELGFWNAELFDFGIWTPHFYILWERLPAAKEVT